VPGDDEEERFYPFHWEEPAYRYLQHLLDVLQYGAKIWY